MSIISTKINISVLASLFIVKFNHLLIRLLATCSQHTRSMSYNFYFNHAVNNLCKTFITFHGVIPYNNLAIIIKESSTLSKFKLFIDLCLYQFIV